MRAVAMGNANCRGGGGCTGNARFGSPNFEISNVFRCLFPRKTWAEIARRLGLCERSAKHRLAGTRGYSAADIANLLRSEEGLKFLSALMADATPRWWRASLAQQKFADARRHQALARRQLQQAIDADADLEATIALAEILPDQDFMRPHVDALRFARSTSRGAMVAKAKGRRT